MKSLVLTAGLFLSANVSTTAQTGAASGPSLGTGSWNVDGSVEGVPVVMTCRIVETNHVISGSCTNQDGVIHTIKGKVQDRVMTWVFDSAYQGQPITLTLSGTIDAAGLKMSGSIAVDPLQADGEFTATKQPTVLPTADGKSPSSL